MKLDRIKMLCDENGWSVQENAPLSAYTTFKVGGPADLLITLPDTAAAVKLLAVCRETDTPTFLLGNGSNLLVGDKGMRGVTWRFDPAAATCRFENETTVVCDAGMSLLKLCNTVKEHGLSGLEFAFGIPGTVGGAMYMNAGAYDGQMADVVKAATVIRSNGCVDTVSADEMALSYRHSAFMDNGDIVTAVTLCLKKGDKAAIRARMQELMDRRRDKQPLEYPSAGSFFKRPPGYFAGALIEQSGLKGFSVGGAAVSEKHAGFVINKGNATAADIVALSEVVVEKIKAKTGVTMQPEVRFVGEF